MKEKFEGPFSSDHYRREDDAPDPYFYSQPRLVVHIDDCAIEAIGEFFAEYLPEAGWILDLMSSWRSHMPEGFSGRKLVGLGLNGIEMVENLLLDGRVI
ncbi:MAG: methyltransferase type 11, partial [Chloroflexi bacterium]|nr:methyltransferase type 11 [Chloroflexota bacterium]